MSTTAIIRKAVWDLPTLETFISFAQNRLLLPPDNESHETRSFSISLSLPPRTNFVALEALDNIVRVEQVVGPENKQSWIRRMWATSLPR